VGLSRVLMIITMAALGLFFAGGRLLLRTLLNAAISLSDVSMICDGHPSFWAS